MVRELIGPYTQNLVFSATMGCSEISRNAAFGPKLIGNTVMHTWAKAIIDIGLEVTCDGKYRSILGFHIYGLSSSFQEN
jgi:hypothetical protein